MNIGRIRNFCLQTGIACGNVALFEGLHLAMNEHTSPAIASIAIINISGISPGG